MMPAKSPNPTAEAEETSTNDATPTPQYAAYVTAGNLAVGLRKRTLLDDRFFQSLYRTVIAMPVSIFDFAAELGYPEKLVDDELVDFLYHSSQVAKSTGVEYAAYGDDWETIKRKYVAYIATPDVDDLWKEVNRAINDLERNPDPITAPGVVSSDPK